MAASTQGTIVRVVNEGATPLKLGWDGTAWVIRPGGQQFVPIEAAMLAFGDPYLRDTATQASRSEEWNRIRVRYGVYSDLHKLDTYVDEKGVVREGHLPKVSVFTAEGELLPMLMHDPEGTGLAPELNVTLDANADVILARLDAIERENASLRAELSKRAFDKAAAAPSIGDDGGPILPARVDGADPAELDEFDGLSIEQMTALVNARASEAAADAAASEVVEAPNPDAPRVDGPPAPGRGKPLGKR